MEDGEDWVLRPVASQMCSYESIKNGAVSLYDLVLMNEYLDVQAENQYRIAKVNPNGG